MRRITMLSIAALLLVGACLAGCNTVKGIGRDIQHAGEDGERMLHGTVRK